MSLFKIPILSLSVWLFLFSSFSPNPPADESERVHGLLYGFPTLLGISYRLSGSIPCIAELAVVTATHFPSTLSSEILSRLVLSGQLPTTDINPYFIVGSILVTVGCLGRLRCYHSLGRYFTYQLAIRKGHKLVTTGPYAIVRHPAYLSGVLSTHGMSLMIASPGSFIYRSRWLETTLGRLIVGVWASQNVLAWVLIYARGLKEDTLLKEKFGEEWERYSGRVRYRLIPGVY